MLPGQHIEPQSWGHLKGLLLADPRYNHPDRIAMLLGADIIGTLGMEGIIQGPDGSPFAHKTALGYILFGRIHQSTSAHLASLPRTIDNYTSVDATLRSFWEIENLPSSRELTQDEIQCGNHFATTHSRAPDGRYTVYLPFHEHTAPLGESRDRAIARLRLIERRFMTNPQLRCAYVEFMQVYLESAHMEVVDSHDSTPLNQMCYLPHHGVIKGSNINSKLRVVFDASCKTTTGVSLNQILHVGPKLQQDLFTVLLRFRRYRYVFIADIKQMYRQILVAAEHRNYQRIVWRTSPAEPIRDYRLRTVTYGTGCAPYLAIRTLHQLAQDEREEFPIATDLIRTDFYVDDLMTGASTIGDLLEVQRQMVTLLKRGGFELRKWSSNCPSLLDQVPPDHHERKSSLELNWDESVKALGLHWEPSRDCFIFKINIAAGTAIVTKRSILSQASQIFDPLGWVAPSVVIAKMTFQELWVLGLSWDEPVPAPLAQRWLKYRTELRSLETIKIARWIHYNRSDDNFQIHGFSDASTKAYAAVVYGRTVLSDGSVKVSILAAKTKVAPLKTISLPRLELCAAVLLGKLMRTIVQSFTPEVVKVFAWTDSQVVLGWLRSAPNRWKTFVANRVSQVLDYLKPSEWYFVETKHNPADCASRGIDPHLLHNHPTWWQGPEWLSAPSDQWPSHRINEFGTSLEERKLDSMVVTQPHHTSCDNDIYSLLTRCSTLGKLLRVTALCRRFTQHLRNSQQRINGFVTVVELSWSSDLWLQLVQRIHFADEISRCQKGCHISNQSPLCTLNPFIDRSGILRVGGRLRHANLPYREKHPAVLPKDDHFTVLIIAQAHRITLHGGPLLMLAYLRQRYWIIHARHLVRLYVRRCVVCVRHRATTSQQLMADLPSPRVTPSRPFLHSGVDYAGPIPIKISKGRGGKSTKGYICLFVCLSTKAMHLELVSELTTNAFIAAFKRFTARRGRIQRLYSDRGTNFIGSSRQLAYLHHHGTRSVNPDIAAALSQDGTTWSFIPPASPHFGGLWEAGVKSVKHHLRRIIGTTLLTFEELTTLLCQIEACLNSRPLCPMSDDPDDCLTLTPGHFLIGEPPITVPEPSLLEVNPGRLRRYQQTQRMYQHFWKIWSTEYLSRLQQRPKWLRTTTNLTAGQLVLIKDEHCPPSKWAMGRVLATHPGSDGLVRTATIKCQRTTLTRPIVKLCSLPVPNTIID